mgnify:CR=1 FL=1
MLRGRNAAWGSELIDQRHPQWPRLFPYIFNVADSLLCTGVFLMIVYSFFHRSAATAERAPGFEPQLKTDQHR